MPDLKDKYSDPELDRSNKAFEEIVNRPDMRALDDQGNAIARNLKDAEDNPDKTDGTDQSRSVKSANNPFGYTRSQPQSQSGGLSGWSKKRKASVFGGVGAGVGGILAILFMLLPLKIPGIMQMISDEAGQRVEQVTEKRAKIILGRAIVAKFASGSGLIITGDGPVSTLVASMRTNNFEKKLAAKGLTIQPSGDGVILKMHGERLGKGVLRNEIEVVRALESRPLSNKLLKDTIKEEIPSWRWMKRAKFAKWLRIKYGIPRYGIENSREADENKRLAAMQEERFATEYEALANDMGEVAECLPSADCEVDPYSEGGDAPDGTNPIGEEAKESGESVAKENSDTTKGATKTLIADITTKLTTKAIPVVGWIDLLATVDHLAYETAQNDFFGKLASYYRAKQYARHFGVWSGYGSQIQLGAMDTTYIGVLAQQTEGIEESQAFNMIDGNTIGNGEIPGTPPNKINANNPSEVSQKFKEIVPLVNVYDTLGGKAAHEVLDFYYRNVNKLFEAIGGFLADITPDELFEWARPLVANTMTKVFELLGLDFDPAVKGSGWFNAAHGGATWTYNDFCKTQLGCRKMSASETALQNSSIAAERAEYSTQQGLSYALFNTDSSRSVTSQLAIHLPTNSASTFSTLVKLVGNAPASLLNSLTGKATATAYVDLHGVDPYGASDAELNQPVDPKAISGDPCSEKPSGNELDLCRADKLVAEAMLCEFEPESADCAENDPSGAEGIDFTVASYNILHSDSHAEKSRAIGGCNQNPVPGDPNCAKTRGAKQIDIITGQAGNPAFDIIGTQETSGEQYDYLKSNLPGYDAFPEEPSRMNNAQDGAVAIFWNTAKFSKIESGKAPGISNTTKEITNPWVGLQASTGQKIYVMSIHYAIQSFGGTPESIKRSSELTIDWVKSKVSDNSIAIVVGDFNDKLGQKLHYCVFTRDSLMQHAVDMSAGANPSDGCSANRFGGIDHIYATPKMGLTASNWTHMANQGIVAQASDHTPVYTKYTIPGETSGSQLRVATFNIYHSDDKIWRERLQRSVHVLKSNNVDIAGLQEVRPDQNQLFRDTSYGGDVYDMYPTALNGPAFSPNPIVWNKSKFKVIKTTSIPFKYFGGSNDQAPMIKFQDIQTGQQFYFANTHDPADARGEVAHLRYQNAVKYAEIFKKLAGDEGLPIFFTGDFNSGYEVRRDGNDTYQFKRENLTYCVLTEPSTTLWDAYDAFKKRDGQCPSTKVDFGDSYPGNLGIDHIFLSRSVEVTKFFRSPAGKQLNGSDVHPTIIADAVIPGKDSAGAGAVGGWSWPVDQKWWKTNRADFLGAHTARGSDGTLTGTAWGGDNMGTDDKGGGIGVDIGDPPDGSPVYAMLGGVVTSTSLCGVNDGIAIKSKVGNATIGIAYMHGTGKRFKVGDTVKSGERIMNIGAIGCNVFGGHVHIGIAYNGRYVCPQDVFLAMDAGKNPDLAALAGKASAPCGRQ